MKCPEKELLHYQAANMKQEIKDDFKRQNFCYKKLQHLGCVIY